MHRLDIVADILDLLLNVRRPLLEVARVLKTPVSVVLLSKDDRDGPLPPS